MNTTSPFPGRAWALILTIVAGTACATESRPAADPAGFVGRFVTALDSLRPTGLPDSAQMVVLAPFLDSSLAQAITAAGAEQAEFIKAHPDEKPPWIEGSLFTSLFEGPTSHSLGTVDSSGAGLRVIVNYVRADPGAKDTVRWNDAVWLRRRADGLVVTDIEYLGEWAFRPGGRLSAVLGGARR